VEISNYRILCQIMEKSFSVMISCLATFANPVLAAALAIELAWIAWSVLSQNRTYEPRTAAAVGGGQYCPPRPSAT
jgi:hypothetical protein